MQLVPARKFHNLLFRGVGAASACSWYVRQPLTDLRVGVLQLGWCFVVGAFDPVPFNPYTTKVENVVSS